MMKPNKFKKSLQMIIATALVIVLLALGFLYSGVYPMGADRPHNDFTHWVLETLRERSIARASKDIEVPNELNTADRLLAGGADYNDMCAGCHMKPGRTESDLSVGLYPAPPNLTQTQDQATDESAHGTHGNKDEQARRRFWIIKHGIKASGMPAWGSGHDDERIWNMVAFLERLPTLSEGQYQILTARGDNDGDSHDDSHGDTH